MTIPEMPSITDLPIQELKKADVAFKVLEENLGEIYNPDDDGICRYYAIFEDLNIFGETLSCQETLYLCTKICHCKSKTNGIGQIWKEECGSLCTPS